jgi:uncharacterized protein (TIRG00374 family)
VGHVNESSRVRRSLIPGLLVSGIAVVTLVAVADPARALQVLLTADPIHLAAAAVVCCIGLVARAAASRELVGGRVTLIVSFAALNIGYLANNLLPLRAGEAVRSVVLGRRSGIGIIGGATAVAAERMLDIVMAATILVASLPAVGLTTGWVAPVAAAAAAMAGVTLLAVIARRRGAVSSWLEPKLASRPRLARLIPRLTSALEGLAHPRRLIRAAFWLGLSWGLGVALYWFVLRAFLPLAPLSWAAFGIGVLAFGIALPSSPGAIGVYEASLVGALALCGVDSADALAFAVAAHALSFGITSIFGLIALVWQVPGGAGVAGRARSLVGDGEIPTPEEAAR